MDKERTASNVARISAGNDFLDGSAGVTMIMGIWQSIWSGIVEWFWGVGESGG